MKMNYYHTVCDDQTARLVKSFCVVNSISFDMSGIGDEVYVSIFCSENDIARIGDYTSRASVLECQSVNYIYQFADWFKECCIPDYIAEMGVTIRDVVNDFANIVALSFEQYNNIWNAVEMVII